MSTPSRRAVLAAIITTLVVAGAACTADSEAGTATATKGAASAAATSAQVKDATAAAPQVLYVANTGGTGVSLRARCEDGARLGGQGLKDGTEVTVTTVGTDQCAGWALVDAAGTTSWVHLSYLAPERPAVVAAPIVRPPVSSGGTAPAPAPAPAPVNPPRFEKVLVYKEHLIPLSQLTYRSADFGPILLTPTGPKPGAYVCPVYNYSAPTVRTTAGVILQDPDPEGCGFARADTAVIRDALIQ
jgi:hypothetical protein